MRKRSTPNVQIIKDELSTSDPMLLHQPTNDADRKHEVRKVRTIIETVQAQLKSLKNRDSQVFRLIFIFEWFDGDWRDTPPISEPVGKLVNTEVLVF